MVRNKTSEDGFNCAVLGSRCSLGLWAFIEPKVADRLCIVESFWAIIHNINSTL